MSADRGAHSLAEILSQPEVWNSALAAFHQQAGAMQALYTAGGFDRIILTGCGSTYYLAQAGAALFQQNLGINARAYPASEIALFPDYVLLPNTKTLLITVSRSGETTETLEAVRVFRERTGQPTVTVTCYGDSALAAGADLAFIIPEAQETSLAQTRSFASMLIVLEALAAMLADYDLSVFHGIGGVAGAIIDGYHSLARQLGEDTRIERFFFLGSGALYGIACEAMLKMKEMSLSYSEAFHVLEFRHGPMSMVDERALVVALLSDEAHPQEAAVLRDMRARGAQVLALGESDYGLALGEHFVPLASGLPRWARPVAYLPFLQLMAYHRALANGQNPDQPANLAFVISLDKSMT